MMREAPLRHDRAAARDDAGHALRGQRNERQAHAGVDREVIDALLGLLDQRVAEELPGEVLGDAANFFERLVDRHRADRHRRIAQDPLARLVDVLAGRKIHDRVRAPADRPDHLLDFLGDRARHGRVADVRVDLHEEIATDDHRLGFGMVDVVRDDRAAARDLVAHELRRDRLRQRRAERLPRMLFQQMRLCDRIEPLVLANRDEFHFRRDDAAPRVVHLRNIRAGAGTTRLRQRRKAHIGELARIRMPSRERRREIGELFRIAALGDPARAQRRQSRCEIDAERRIRVRPGRVVDDERHVLLGAEHRRRIVERDLAHRHGDVVAAAAHVDLASSPESGASRFRKARRLRAAARRAMHSSDGVLLIVTSAQRRAEACEKFARSGDAADARR